MLLFKILKQVFFNCLNLKLNSILLYYIPFCFKWKLLIQLQFIDRQNNTVHRILKQFFSSPEGENFLLAKLNILVNPLAFLPVASVNFEPCRTSTFLTSYILTYPLLNGLSLRMSPYRSANNSFLFSPK